jgi:hypothetical protein
MEAGNVKLAQFPFSGFCRLPFELLLCLSRPLTRFGREIQNSNGKWQMVDHFGFAKVAQALLPVFDGAMDRP